MTTKRRAVPSVRGRGRSATISACHPALVIVLFGGLLQPQSVVGASSAFHRPLPLFLPITNFIQNIMAQRNNWLRGTIVRKTGVSTATNTRTSTSHIQSTSTTIYGGGVKDPSGRTTEYFVCESAPLTLSHADTHHVQVHGRSMSGVQVGQVPESKVAPSCVRLLS